MGAATLIAEANAIGVILLLEDGRLSVEGPEAVVDSILPRLKAEREGVIRLLRGGTLRDRHERLCKMIDEAVDTPHGRGRLWQVFGNRVGVVIGDRVRFMDPADVILDAP